MPFRRATNRTHKHRGRGARLAHSPGVRIDNRDALLVNPSLDDPRDGQPGIRRPGRLRQVFGEQDGDRSSIRRPLGIRQESVHMGQLPRRSAIGRGNVKLQLSLPRSVREERQVPSIGRPGQIMLAMRCDAIPCGNPPRFRRRAQRGNINRSVLRRFVILSLEVLNPGYAGPIPRNRCLFEGLHLEQGIHETIKGRLWGRFRSATDRRSQGNN